MDKAESNYYKDNHELTIASKFITDTPIKEMIKAYILENQRSGIRMAVQRTGGDPLNTIAATLKEVGL
ncbi:hypothetical protein [Anaerotignum sp.]